MLNKHRKIQGICKYILKSLENGEESGSYVSHITKTSVYYSCALLSQRVNISILWNILELGSSLPLSSWARFEGLIMAF